jgi:2-amino-4-hydroxy-6-hydroxymethyldihydropteridine diphosphokinase/dihydropteroate synthase
MIILGLGTNMGDRLAYLRQALQFIKKMPGVTVQQVSPVYISDALLPDNAPVSWDMPYLNLALRCETTLSPYDLLHLVKQVEKKMGRVPGKEWGPRPIDIDILAWDDLIQYDDKLHIPHENLHERPFALWPLADVAPRWIYPLPGMYHGKTAAEISEQWGSRFSGDAPLHTKQIAQRIDTPHLMGIINVTPDSFSDGGAFLSIDSAIQHAHQLVNAGAEVLDIGAEATGPAAISLSAETEWQRLEPLLTHLLATKNSMLIPPKISVDTRHAWVAKKALALGVDCINDVTGLSHSDMQQVITDHDCDVVIMHQLGIPVDQNRVLPREQNPVTAVYTWAAQQIEFLDKRGIAPERIIVDIGIGYGKTKEQSLELLQHIDEFRSLNTRLLVGHSRKSFLTFFTDKPAAERDIETVAISLFLPVDYLRIHNVDLCARGFKVAKSLLPSG